MTENIVLDKQIIEKAKNVSCKVENSAARKRVYALNIAANAAEEYLQSKGFAVNTKSSLYKIPAFAQDIEIADIYVNNIKLDVRVTFDDNTFYIPKIQEKYGAQPCAYLVTKLDSALNDIKILGFVDAQSLEKQNATEYYCYETALLKPIDELKNFIYNAKPQSTVPTPEELEKIKELAVSFLENSISDSEKVYFIKNVIKYAACREVLADMNDFDKVANHISNYEELLNDSTLSVLSGNSKEVDEAILANMATLENAEENTEETQEPADNTEEAVLEDELFDLNVESDLDLDKNDEVSMLEELNEEEITEKTEAPAVEAVEELAENEVDEVVEEKINDFDTISLEDVESEPETLLEFEDETEEEIIKPMGVISTDTNENTLAVTETEDEKPLETFEVLETLDFQDAEENISEDSFVEEEISEEFENKNEETEEVDEIKLQFEENEFSEFSKEIVEENITENTDADETELLQDTEALEETTMLEEVEEDSISGEDDVLEEEPIQHLEEESIQHLEEADDFLLEHENSDDMLLEDLDEEPSKPETKPSAEVPEQETPQKPFKLTLEGEEEEDIIEESEENVEELEENVEESQETEEITELEPEQIAEEKTVYSSQEPVEMVYDDEDEKGDETPDTSFEDLSDSEPQMIENTEEAPQDSEDSQIQELLDDDLLALLASESEERENEAAKVEQESPAQAQASAAETTFVSSESQEVVEYTENTALSEDKTSNREDFEQKEYEESETIQTLYDSNETPQDAEGKDFELAQEPVSEKTVKATKNIVIAVALLLFLAGSGTAAWFVNQAKTADKNAVDASNQDGELFDFQNSAGSSNDDAIPALSQDINKSMTNSFSDKPAAITITKLSWQVSEKLASENSVKEYLQTTGKNIQIKLQNDLANAADINFNNSIKVSFEIAPDNTLKGMQVLESSGSDQIDDMVQRSIKETLKYISVPKLKDFKSDYFLTLIINF